MGKRILIVDDDISFVSAARRALKAAGHEPALASSGPDAEAVMEHGAPDLVLLSLSAGGGVGLQIADSLVDQSDEGLPIVFVGDGRGPVTDRASALAHGGKDYVQKPLDWRRFIESLPLYLGDELADSGAAGGMKEAAPSQPARQRADQPTPSSQPEYPVVQRAEDEKAFSRRPSARATAEAQPESAGLEADDLFGDIGGLSEEETPTKEEPEKERHGSGSSGRRKGPETGGAMDAETQPASGARSSSDGSPSVREIEAEARSVAWDLEPPEASSAHPSMGDDGSPEPKVAASRAETAGGDRTQRAIPSDERREEPVGVGGRQTADVEVAAREDAPRKEVEGPVEQGESGDVGEHLERERGESPRGEAQVDKGAAPPADESLEADSADADSFEWEGSVVQADWRSSRPTPKVKSRLGAGWAEEQDRSIEIDSPSDAESVRSSRLPEIPNVEPADVSPSPDYQEPHSSEAPSQGVRSGEELPKLDEEPRVNETAAVESDALHQPDAPHVASAEADSENVGLEEAATLGQGLDEAFGDLEEGEGPDQSVGGGFEESDFGDLMADDEEQEEAPPPDISASLLDQVEEEYDPMSVSAGAGGSSEESDGGDQEAGVASGDLPEESPPVVEEPAKTVSVVEPTNREAPAWQASNVDLDAAEDEPPPPPEKRAPAPTGLEDRGWEGPSLEVPSIRAPRQPAPVSAQEEQVSTRSQDDASVAKEPPTHRREPGLEGREGDESPCRSAEVEVSPVANARWRSSEGMGETPLDPTPQPGPAPFAEAGELACVDLPHLLAAAWRGRATGLLEVQGPAGKRRIYFELGRPVAAVSDVLEEQLPDVALRLGRILKEQADEVRREGERSPRRQAIHLVESGALKAQELYDTVRAQALEALFGAFTVEEGRWQWLEEGCPNEMRVALPDHPFALITDGIRRKLSLARIHRRLGGPGTLLVASKAPELHLLDLTARERRLAEQVDGLKTAEELVFISGLGEEATYQVLYALTATGQAKVQVRGPMPEGRAFTPEEREVEVMIDRRRIDEKFRQALESDYFEILGVPPEATAYEIRSAHERLSRVFHPGRYAVEEFRDLWGKLEEIRRSLDDAHDVLKDEGLRADYIDALRARR